MLNIAQGVYHSGPAKQLPVPLIKEIKIIPETVREEGPQVFSIEAQVLVQTSARGYSSPFNLHVSAFTDPRELKIYKNHGKLSGLKELALRQNHPLSKNIGIDRITPNDTPYIFNDNSSSAIVYKTIKVPMKIETTQKLAYLSLVVFTNDLFPVEDNVGHVSVGLEEAPFRCSRPAIEIVLASGRPLRTSNIFKLRDEIAPYGAAGDVWSGPVHNHPDTGLMVEAAHSSGPHPRVLRTMVPNQKIKDYRIVNLNDFLKTPPPTPPATPPKYISDIYYSRNTNNEVNMFFSFDLLSYISDNSGLSHVFKNKMSLLTSTQIAEVRVYRTRVNNQSLGNELTADKLQSDVGGQPQYRELVALLSEQTVKRIRASRHNQNGIVEMVAIDREMANLQESYFNYEIEIEILDNSPDALKQIISDLNKEMTKFQTYMSQFFNHQKRNYDVDAYIAASVKTLKGVNSWKGLLSEYVSSLMFLSGNQVEGRSLVAIAQPLMALADPYSATQESLQVFENLVNEYILLLEEVLSPGTEQSDTPENYHSAISATSAAARRLLYIPEIKEYYLNELGKESGFDYVGDALQEVVIGFNRITYDDYVNRVAAEVEKYEVQNANAPTINKYGFLSPAVLRTATGDIPTGKTMPFRQSLDILQANSFSPYYARNYVGNPEMGDYEQISIDNILSLEGVSYEELKQNIKRSGDDAPPPAIDSAEYLSSTSNFVRDGAYLEDARLGSSSPRILNPTKASKFVDNPLIQRLVERNASFSKEVKVAGNLVNVQGSLAYAQLDASTEAFDNLNVFEQNINFNSLVRVEYLQGYRNTVRELNWKILDWETLNKAIADNRPLLCRLTRPENILNISNKFKLSEYDSVFVIGNNDLRSDRGIRTPAAQIAVIKEKINKLYNKSVLGNKRAGGAVLSQYLSSDLLVYGGIPNRTSASRGRRY